MTTCVNCGKVNVTGAAVAYCKRIDFGPHCHTCQQKKGLNRYEITSNQPVRSAVNTQTVTVNQGDHDEHALEVIGWIYDNRAFGNITYLEKTICNHGKYVSADVWTKAQQAIAYARKGGKN